MKKLKSILSLWILGISMLYLVSCGGSRTSTCSHTYGPWIVSKAAICEEDGQKTKTCSKCGYVKTQKITAKGHDFKDGICTVCGKHE